MAATYKSVRRKTGYSQVDVAQIAGVSERTVRRFEKGESKNAKLTSLYDTLTAQAKDIDKLRAKVQRMYQQRERSMEAIKKFMSQKGVKGTYAFRAFETEVKNRIRNTPIGKMRYEELLKIQNKLESMSTWQTSTLKGYKEWYKHNKEARSRYFGTESLDVLELFLKIKNETFLVAHCRKITKKDRDSDAIVAYIDMKKAAGYNTSEIYDLLVQEATNAESLRTEKAEKAESGIFFKGKKGKR